MAEVLPYLEKIKQRLDEPDFQRRRQSYARTIQFNFPDINENYVLVLNHANPASLEKGVSEKPDATITANSEAYAAVQQDKMDRMKAFNKGLIRFKGDLDILMRLRILWG